MEGHATNGRQPKKGNIRIQITTPDVIYFYLIDKNTYMPQLQNAMYNYMGCN